MSDNARVKMNVTLPRGEVVGVSAPAHLKYEDLLRDLSQQYEFPEEDYEIWHGWKPANPDRCVGETELDETETDGRLNVHVRRKTTIEDLLRAEFLLYGCPRATTGEKERQLPESVTIRLDL